MQVEEIKADGSRFGKFTIAIPHPLEDKRSLMYFKIKEDCFTPKQYPYCEQCKTKYVPIDNKCFKCLFKSP